jgi:hypothetical protein
VSVAELPLQIVVAELLIVNVGRGFTKTLTVDVLVQPSEFVPATV